MRQARFLGLVALGASLAGGDLRAQATTDAPVPAAEADEKAWSFSASAFGYLLPEESDYAQPTFTADRDWLHLEARYNYESLKAGSVWIGYNWSMGEKVTFDLTPMLGGVFGDTTGIAPGYKLSSNWRRLEFSSESEYVFDTGRSSDSFTVVLGVSVSF